MTSFQELVDTYVIGQHNLIRKVTAPLHNYFGSVYFTYHRIDAEGNYLSLVDRPDWAEYYGGNELYRLDPYLRHPKHYSNGISILSDMYRRPELREIHQEMERRFGFGAGILLIERSSDAVEMFGVCTPSGEGVLDRCLEEIGLYRHFCSHFKTRCKHLIAQLAEEPVDLQRLKPQQFSPPNSVSHQPVEREKQRLLGALGLNKVAKEGASLSEREREVLRLACEGHSARTSALHLHLSPRTVEHYLDNAKERLATHTREELLLKGRQLLELGYLD